jgi:hypothetical protein
MQVDAMDVSGERYYLVTVFGDETPGQPAPGPQASGADPATYWAGKKVTMTASTFVADRELSTWRPDTLSFLKALKNKSPFGLKGTVLMAVFKAGNSNEILATTKFAYTTPQNPKLPYERTFDLDHEPEPQLKTEDYVWGEVPSQAVVGPREDLDTPVELPDPTSTNQPSLRSRVKTGKAVEFGAWVKNPKSSVDFLPLMWYLAERKGLNTLASPMVQKDGKTVYVYPAEYREWCPNALIPYYGQFGFHPVRQLGNGMVLMAASREELRKGVGEFIRNRVAKSPALRNVSFHFGVDTELPAMSKTKRWNFLLSLLLGDHCDEFFESLFTRSF